MLMKTNSSWQQEFVLNPNVSKYSPARLQKYLDIHRVNCNLDSYSLSPAYYAMTGRKGAWLYEKDDTAVVVCQHPNVNNKVLVFPEIGKGGVLKYLIEEISVPTNGVQLARVPSENVQKLMEELASTTDIATFKAVEEKVLDWQYPSQILSTKEVGEMKGGAFGRARGRRNKFLELYEYDTNHSNLDGTVVYCNGNIEAINIVAKPVITGQPAVYLYPFFNTNIVGLSEFSYNSLCQRLHKKGIKTLDAGGSETEELDRYKRKFAPIESKKLSTIKILKSSSF